MKELPKYDNIVGIDPDVDKSGVAWLRRSGRLAECSALPFPELVDYIRYVKARAAELDESYVVIVEAGWLNRSNWHLARGTSAAKAAKTGENVGRNIETGRKIAEMCRHYDVNCLLRRPLPKCWRGRDRKITSEEMNAQLRIYGYPPIHGRTNQEMRDALLIALVG